MRLRLLVAAGVLVAMLVAAAPAGAFILQPVPMLSATNGIALGPDGNFWIAEQTAGSVARMTPAGTILARFAVGANPTTVTTGPGGRVWVAVTGAQKLVWIDATSPTPTMHDVSTGPLLSCGPIGLAPGDDARIYFTLPTQNGCLAGNVVNSVAADGTGMSIPVATTGAVFDLVSTQGALFAAGPEIGVIVRYALGAPVVAQTTIQAGSGPKGIAADGLGNVWFTDALTGGVGHFPAGQNGGMAPESLPLSGSLLNPFGIVAGADGNMYVAASQTIASVSPAGGFRFFPAPGSSPFRIVNGTDADFWFTDQATARVVRFLSGPPRVTTGAATATSARTAAVAAIVDPRGNDTSLVLELGTTTAYGGTGLVPVTVPAGPAPVATGATLTGLTPSTTYHVRARASNNEGTVVGGDQTFTTPAAPRDTTFGGAPRLPVTINFGFSRHRTYTILKTIALKRLRGAETVTIRCTGSRRCRFKTKRVKNVKAGKLTFGRALLRARRLPVGTTISVQVTKSGAIGAAVTFKVRKGLSPRITRRCLGPGASKPTAC